MKAIVKRIFSKIGYEIEERHPVEERAADIYEKYAEFTMIPERLFIDNLKLVWNFRDVEGCVVECGVWRGGMSAGMAELLENKRFFLCDSFEGLPEAKEIDGEGALKWQSQPQGRTYFDNCKAEMSFAERAMKLSRVKFKLINGWFNESLPKVQFDEPIAILRLDGDWYDSTMDCLVNLYPKVSYGGLIILDDYYTWDGCSRAVHDYLSKHSLTARLHETLAGVPYLVKKN